MSTTKATHQQTKLHNRDLILRTILEHAPISRAEIARRTRLTRTTVSAQVAALLTEGLIEEMGYGPSSGGKAPILLRVVSDSRYLIGLNLARDRFTGAIINLVGEIKATADIPVDGQQGAQAEQLVCRLLDRLLDQDWQPVVGIGIGTPGLVNTREGRIIQAVNLGWEDFPLAQHIAERYRLPVSLLNDSQAAAIGEFRYGGWRAENLLVVTLRHGIGAGLLIGGSLFQGDDNAAGEIGHIVVEPGGRQCRCGQRGCLETVASVPAILGRAQALAPRFPESLVLSEGRPPAPEALGAAYALGDPLAAEVLNHAARHLGRVLAHLAAMLNIHTLVLTGDAPRFGTAWLNAVQQATRGAMLPSMAQQVQLHAGRLPFNHACMLGASAHMLLENYHLLYIRMK